jgi:hypothetical protein
MRARAADLSSALVIAARPGRVPPALASGLAAVLRPAVAFPVPPAFPARPARTTAPARRAMTSLVSKHASGGEAGLL